MTKHSRSYDAKNMMMTTEFKRGQIWIINFQDLWTTQLHPALWQLLDKKHILIHLNDTRMWNDRLCVYVADVPVMIGFLSSCYL